MTNRHIPTSINKQAVLANTAYAAGEKVFIKHKEADGQYEMYKKFDDTYSATATTRGHYIAMLSEAGFTVPMLLLLVETTGSSFYWAKFTMVFIVYFIFMYYITKMAAEFIFAASPELLQLQHNLLNLEENVTSTSFQHARTKASNSWKGYALGASFISTLVLLGLFRNYLINGSVWFIFDSPDDILLLVFPVLIGIVIIYLGRYKMIAAQLRQWKKRRKKLAKTLEDLKEDTLEFSQQFSELYYQAQSRNITLPDNADIKICLERMKTKSIADRHFFAANITCTVQVVLLDNDIPIKNTSLEANTVSGEQLHGTTNEYGLATFQWKALEEEDYLIAISINGNVISNLFLTSGECYTLQLPSSADESATASEGVTIHLHKNGQDKEEITLGNTV